MLHSRKNNCYVRILKPSEVAGKWNNSNAWVAVMDAWVSIDPDWRGREVGAANETVSVVTHVIRGDFYALEGVTEKMVVVYHATGNYDPTIPDDAGVYDILAVMPDESNRQDVMLKAQHKGRTYGVLIKP